MPKKNKRRLRSLKKRYQHNEKQDKRGNRIYPLQFPEGIEFFKPKVGDKRGDANNVIIVPYEITSKNHPLVRKGDMEIGETDFMLDYWVHRGIGEEGKEIDVVCLKKTYGEPCPCCEKYDYYASKGNEEGTKALKPSQRVIYNLKDLDSEGPLKIFTVSYWLFQKELNESARAEGADREEGDGSPIDYAHPDAKIKIRFRGKYAKLNGNKYIEFFAFKFREHDIDVHSLIDDAVCLDSCLNPLSYEKIKAILEGTVVDDEDVEDDEEKIDEDNEVEDEYEEEEEEEEEEEKPKPKKKPKPVEKKKKGKCPNGFAFGTECDKYDECDDCEVWEECDSVG